MNQMTSNLDRAKSKLSNPAAHGLDESSAFPFDDLPADRNDCLWVEIKEAFGLTLAELSALKNARCALSAGTCNPSPGVAKPQKGDAQSTPLGKRDTGKQQSLTKKLIRRCDTKADARCCEICDTPSAVLETAHLFDLSREAEFAQFYQADREHIPISINNAENGLLICRNCHGYFDKKPERLLHIKPDGTIELTGLAKEQNYANLHGKKVPWWENIDGKDWPTSALLEIVYNLRPKTRKRKGGTDFDLGIVDTLDLRPPSSTPPNDTRKTSTEPPKRKQNSRKLPKVPKI